MPRRSTLVRILLLSDTHGVLDPAIEALCRECDMAVHAGDVGNAAVLDALRDACGRVIAVRGNNDVASKWPRADAKTLAALRDVEAVDVPGGTLLVTHGDRFAPAQRHARLRAQFSNARAVVYGHSHHLVVDDGAMPWIVNPGAAGRSRTHGGPSALVLSASSEKWHIESRRFAMSRTR